HTQFRLQLRQRRQHGLRNFKLRQPLFLKRLLPPILHFDLAAVFVALIRVEEIERDQPAPFPKFIHAFIRHQSVEPRFEIRFVTEPGDVREEFQKDLLRHVARRALVAREAQGDRPHAILVGVEQIAKSFAISALTGFDQTPLARHLTHYDAPFHKMPEVAPSDSCGGFLWQIPVANPAVKFHSRSLDGTDPEFLPYFGSPLRYSAPALHRLRRSDLCTGSIFHMNYGMRLHLGGFAYTLTKKNIRQGRTSAGCRFWEILGTRFMARRRRSALFAHLGVALGVDFIEAFLLLGRQRFTDAGARAGARLNETGAFGEPARGKFLAGLFEDRSYLCDLLIIKIQIVLQPLGHSGRPARVVGARALERTAVGQIHAVQRTACHHAERKDDRDQQPDL